MNIRICFIVFYLFLYSCQSKNRQDINDISLDPAAVKAYNDEAKKSELINKIVTQGDTASYNELYYTYALSGNNKEWLYYAFIMANDFNHPEAYYDLYNLLDSDSQQELKSNKLANYYLLKAYEKGFGKAQNTVEEKFKDSIPKSFDYLKEIESE